MQSNHYNLGFRIDGRFVIVQSLNHMLAWGAGKWVGHDEGYAFGDIAVTSFRDAEAAHEHAAAAGLILYTVKDRVASSAGTR